MPTFPDMVKKTLVSLPVEGTKEQIDTGAQLFGKYEDKVSKRKHRRSPGEALQCKKVDITDIYVLIYLPIITYRIGSAVISYSAFDFIHYILCCQNGTVKYFNLNYRCH